VSSADKYTGGASEWTTREYADAETYLRRRVDLIAAGLAPGDTVLDLACGDGGLGDFVTARGFRYLGADLNEAMVAAARRRGYEIAHADLNDFAPAEPVAATTLFRALYYARDRAAFFRHVASYTERKLVFDVNPRQYQLDDVVRDLRSAGFEHVEARPFFVPQNVSLGPFALLAQGAERVPALARAILRFRFTYVVSASPYSSSVRSVQ
jgi:SAM-dependent methyltransferase